MCLRYGGQAVYELTDARVPQLMVKVTEKPVLMTYSWEPENDQERLAN